MVSKRKKKELNKKRKNAALTKQQQWRAKMLRDYKKLELQVDNVQASGE